MANHPSHPDERDGILMILRKSLIHVRWLSQNTDWEIQLVLIITCKMRLLAYFWSLQTSDSQLDYLHCQIVLLPFMQKVMKIFIIIVNGINGFVRYLASKVSTLESCVSLERTRVNIKYWTLHAMWSKLNSNLYQFSSKRNFHTSWKIVQNCYE